MYNGFDPIGDRIELPRNFAIVKTVKENNSKFIRLNALNSFQKLI
jgi:hypothetical protein